MGNTLTGAMIIEREEAKSLLALARQMAPKNSYNHSITLAFEEYGCSCAPDRQVMEELRLKMVAEEEAAVGTLREDYAELRESNREIIEQVKAQHQRDERLAMDNLEAALLPLKDNETRTAYDEVKKRIQDTDRAEHPELNRQAREAIPFFHTWLVQQVRLQGGSALLEGAEVRFTDAWMGGWRP